jgi:peptidoglycan biosynthesis protein MviN/MurJ (putative lipid II flippase)
MAVDRKPTALALKLWLFVAMTPYVTTISPLPQSIGAGPDVFGYATVGSVWLGALLSLIGLVWRGEALNGLVIEQVGLIGICAGLLLYMVGVLTFVPLTEQRAANVGFAVGLCAAVAAGAAWQYFTIRRYRLARLGPPGDGSAEGNRARPEPGSPDFPQHSHG